MSKNPRLPQCMYVGMRPQAFGHPEKKDWADAEKTIEKLRTEFIEKEVRVHATSLSAFPFR